MVRIQRTFAPDKKTPHKLKDEIFIFMYWFDETGKAVVGTTADRTLTKREFAMLEQGLVEFQAAYARYA